ncbi:MAG: hypothetical protein IJX37_02760 [Oscillospiraceae bacterium]|nr:hypothetical protein [Oscillospiraceae bacterium]
MEIHRFLVSVNCSLPNDREITDGVQDHECLYTDHGFLILPDTYTHDGEKTRLVIYCHGAGGTVTTDDSQVEHTAITQYLVANGFAVMDVNGLPERFAAERGIDIRNNVGSLIALRCYVKAYHYCMDHFNLKSDVFVHGSSMGGISSTNLVLSGMIPVIAQTGFCPVLDTYNEIFLKPWGGGLPKAALGKIYDFAMDKNGEYIYDAEKVCGCNPAINDKRKSYPVPVKFWHCVDDPIVSFAVTEKFVNTIKAGGGIAYLRPFPYGGHEPQQVGKPVVRPSGNDILNGKRLEITPAVEEAFVWIRNFD